MLPLGVFQELTRFAKSEVQTGLGKFDYGLAIKLLLERNNINTRLDKIENQLNKMEDKQHG